MRGLVAALVLLGALVAAPGAASALWSAAASGTPSVPAATLGAPTGTSVTAGPTVRVSWTAAAPWAGHRVLRGVSPTDLAQVGADQPTATSIEDAPGAGTHYYAVVAYRNGWTGPRGPVVPRAERDYVMTAAAPTNGTAGCAAAASTTGMRQGHQPTGAGAAPSLGSTTFSLCTDTWTTGQSLPAGTTTVTAHVTNTTNNRDCAVALTVRAGTTTMGSATVVVQAGASAQTPSTWAVPTSAYAFTTGQRLTLTLSPGGGQGCSSTTLHAGGATYPSKVTLTA